MAEFHELDPIDFKQLYPMYADIADDILDNLWIAVELNSPGFIWAYSQKTANYYWYIVLAHYCQLWTTQQAGRIKDASEGKVSMSLEDLGSPNLQWWCSTNWGNQIAQLLRRRGGFTYIPESGYYGC